MLDCRSMTPVRATAALGLLVAVSTAALPARADPPPVTTRRGVVAADHEAGAAAGARVLAAGGNAVDAAVATALAQGVVNPTSSGIGGGGFALVYRVRDGVVHAVDFRETAPAAADPALYAGDLKRGWIGGLAVGVPGEVAGLAWLVDSWGTRSWRSAVAPAIRLARDGFTVSAFFARIAGEVLPVLPDEPAFDGVRALLDAPNGGRVEGAVMVRPELADTLAAIAAGGADAFYRGPIADDVVATARAAGGVITADDLAGYRVVEREPLWGAWRGYRIATMPLPSSGGVAVLEAFGILDASRIDLAALGVGSAAQLHVVAEALKHAFADRARLLGDTSTAGDAIAALLDRERLAGLAARIDLDKTLAHDRYGGGTATATVDDGGTTHICVIDEDGNAVALTTTVNGYYGSKLVTAGGFPLNNEIDDFTLQSGKPNAAGLVQSDENLIAPGKRPLSSMSPTLVFDADGKVVACAGGSGGPRIISSVTQVLLGVLVLGLDAAQAVSAPRIHHQWTPDVLAVDAAMPEAVVKDLEARGHATRSAAKAESVVQVIVVRPDGTREAAADPRKGGVPVAQ
jgi:gamma-glutamyltranspeptidase / glutathione hydrolase